MLINKGTNSYQLNDEYPLEEPQGVFSLMSNIHHVKSSAYDKGDFDAINLLIDFERAYNKIDMTERQKEVIEFVFTKGYTQQETAKEFGIARQTVHQIIWNVVNKTVKQIEKYARGV